MKDTEVKLMIKICEFCGKSFEVSDDKHGQRKRFCNTSCSAKWRNKTFGPNLISEETKRKNAQILRDRWKDVEFRKKKIEYMKNYNPTYIPGVIEKSNKTKLQRGHLPNNFKYGNGKISEYEMLVYNDLIQAGFYYNYAINTKLARDTFPDRHYAKSYKPDFTNTLKKLCIEIDGRNHTLPEQIKLDKKKEECLEFLGFKTVRFTHEQIKKGEFKKWLNSFLNEQ